MAGSSAFSRIFGLFNPLRAIRDFRTVWYQENPYRWRFFALSLAVTFSIFSVMFAEEYRIQPRPPDVLFVETFEPGRSDAEIIAANIENQRLKEQRRAERIAREAEIRQRYETVARASGMDEAAIAAARRRGEAERAAAERAREEAQRQALETLGN